MTHRETFVCQVWRSASVICAKNRKTDKHRGKYYSSTPVTAVGVISNFGFRADKTKSVKNYLQFVITLCAKESKILQNKNGQKRNKWSKNFDARPHRRGADYARGTM